MIKKLAAIGAIGVFSTCLFAQGNNTTQTKDQWEEINFEFNSSILSDGYPSLLKLAELLGQHPDYRVKLVGNTDYVGSARYNEGLAKRRAESVKAFLVKYGAPADHITTSGDGKNSPEVDNKTKEGRFMNRRVVMTVTDGTGKVVAEGGCGDVLLMLKELLQKQEECCSNILKRLDKLDEILAELRGIKGENDRLKGEVDALKVEVDNLKFPETKRETPVVPPPLPPPPTPEHPKFSLLGLNVGPTLGNRPNGDVTISGSGQFFAPFGSDNSHAVQAQGEYIRYPGDQEGQFDLGLVNRWDHLQAGMFASMKYIRLEGDTNGGSMGQGAFLLDYIFGSGRVGLYGTEGFKNTGALLTTGLGPSSFLETYARPMDQFGGTFQVGTWGDAWIQGNVGYIHSRSSNPNRPGGEIKLVQPLMKELAFTVRAGLNPTMLTASNTGELTFGLEFGNFMRPKEFSTFTHPIPMDVPRIRYELLTKQVGHSAPVADAGPNQIGVPPGTITLNGSASYSPDHDPLTYTWTQVFGPSVALTGMNASMATFSAAASTSYGFRLTVTDTVSGLFASADTTVTTTRAFSVTRFTATPPNINSGQSSTLTWNVPGATSVTISGGVGSNLAAAGTATVSPTSTTTYNLTATNSSGATATASVTVTVGASKPIILRFQAAPYRISTGQSSLLSWATTGAASVSISPTVGSQPVNGSVSVSPTATTTYTLTATGADGVTTVTAGVTVTVGNGAVPTVVSFGANPSVIASGSSTSLCWNVSGATSISIAPSVGNVSANGCQQVSPTTNTTYILTATNAVGSIQATATVSVGGVQILTFSSNPAFSPASSAPVVLSWTTQNATSVILTGTGVPGGSLPVNGSVTINPTTNSDYTLTAYGPGGPVSSTIQVFVR